MSELDREYPHIVIFHLAVHIVNEK